MIRIIVPSELCRFRLVCVGCHDRAPVCPVMSASRDRRSLLIVDSDLCTAASNEYVLAVPTSVLQRNRQALMPPSTVRFAPLMYDDSGPATNATSAATSSACPYRSSGTAAFWPAAHSPEAGFRSVSMGPG